MRQIVLDTETTGLEPEQGHRIIEIGCVELMDRRLTGNDFHHYLQPDRVIDSGAIEVHGITNEFLEDKPRFTEVASELLDYLRGAELIIHNAAFDLGFLDHELGLLAGDSVVALEDICAVTDTLLLARRLHPGQRNSLDALCSRYEIDNSRRQKHGALLDAEILAEVYLAMTGGQVALSLETSEPGARQSDGGIRRLPPNRLRIPVVRAGVSELEAHERYLEKLEQASGGPCAWRALTETKE